MPAITPARWAELSPHLDALLTLPPLDRARRLDELAANDPRTAADLRELLASREGASRVAFLGGVADDKLLPARVQAGDALGPWTLVEAIGEGGMGTVWRARRSDGRYEGQAAIKLLKSGLFDSGAQERFRREGAILAGLKHPGIAQLLDAGVTPQGQPYLVLELVQGERIDRWCDARGLHIRQRIELFIQVLDAVQAAHAQLAIHRDLKPSNILVGEDGRVKLLDFGIARLLPGAEAEQTALTREGSFALTPEYAAPEQFEGGVLSVATDVYALGVVLFELLSGTHPAGLPAGAPPLQHMRAALEGELKTASVVAAARRRAELRGDLDNILVKALRRQAAERYATVASLADDLKAYLQDRPVAARPDALWYRLGKFVRRNRLGVGLGALALGAAAAGVAGTLVQAERATQQAERAITQEQRARGLATESQGLRSVAEAQTAVAAREAALARRSAAEALAAAAVAQQQRERADAQARRAEAAGAAAQRARDRALRSLAQAESINEFTDFLLSDGSARPFTTAELLARAEAMVQGQFLADHEQRARLLMKVGGQYVELQDGARAQALLDRARDASRLTRDAVLIAEADCSWAAVDLLAGQFDAAEAALSGALASLQRQTEADAGVQVDCLITRAQTRTQRGNADAAVGDAKQALALLKSPRPGQRMQVVNAHGAAATAYARLGRPAEALQEHEHIQTEVLAMGRQNTAFAGSAVNNLGVAQARAGWPLAASASFERALAIGRSINGDAPNPSTQANLAQQLAQIGREAEALRLLDDALKLSSAQPGQRINGSIAIRKAGIHCQRGEQAECAAEIQRARAAMPPSTRADHPTRGAIANLETHEALLRGALAEAEAAAARAEVIFAGGARDKALGLLRTRLNQLDLNLARGLPAAAMVRAQEAMALAGQLSEGFKKTAYLGTAWLQMALVHEQLGAQEQSVAAAERAWSHLQFSQGDGAPQAQRARALMAGRR